LPYGQDIYAHGSDSQDGEVPAKRFKFEDQSSAQDPEHFALAGASQTDQSENLI
jgi:hypothetical protein